MHVSTYLELARRWWFTLLVATWVAGVAGYLVASQVPPTFEARAQLLVGPVNTDFNTLRASGQVAQTYAALATSTSVVEEAVQRVGVPLEPADVTETMRATANEVTRILSIRVQHGDPNVAAAVANEIGAVIRDRANEGTVRPEGTVTIVEAAAAPTAPIAPSVSLIAALSALAGLLLALVLASLVEYLSGAVRTPAEVANGRLAAPLLGIVPRGKRSRSGRGIVVQDQPHSPAARAYHVIATKIDLAQPHGGTRSILVTTPGADEETATLAANLASAAAEGRGRVVVIDATGALAPLGDGRGSRFRIVSVDEEDVDRDDTESIRRIVDRERDRATLILIAGPPVLAAPSGLPWARVADATVVAVHRDQTTRSDLHQALDSLRFIGATVIGLVYLHDRSPRFAEQGTEPPRLPEPAPLTAAPAGAARSGSNGGARRRSGRAPGNAALSIDASGQAGSIRSHPVSPRLRPDSQDEPA